MIQLRLFGSPSLRRNDGQEVLSIVAQPKRFAVLAWLVLAHGRGYCRRDALLAAFWPELDTEHARAALRKTIYHLRQALGAAVIVNRGDEEIGVGDGMLWCDVTAFQDAVGARDFETALHLYRGDLLPGFFLSDTPEFERWLDEERERCRRQAVAGAWTLVAAAPDDLPTAIEWGRRAMTIAPGDEPGLRRLLALLARGGDRAEALRVYEEYRRRVEGYGFEPEAQTQALIHHIRSGDGTPANVSGSDADVTGTDLGIRSGSTSSAVEGGGLPPIPLPASARLGHGGPAPAENAASPPRSSVRVSRRFRRVGVAALVAIVGSAAVTFAFVSPSEAPSEEEATLALGEIRNLTGIESAASPLSDLLATNLARVPGLKVISPARIQEILIRSGATRTGTGVLAAARGAGADQVIEGALYRQPDNALRLDLRRVRLTDGTVLASHTARGSDAFALVDEATAEIVRDLRGAAPALQIADVTTHSLVAYRFYQQGLRSYYQGDLGAAQALFDAALAEDSSFAMAAYYASRSTSPDWQIAQRYLARAVRMAKHASSRERLLIRWRWAERHGEPAQLAIAESLASQYPAELDGQYSLGHTLTWAGDFSAAVPRLRSVVDMDSAGLARNHPDCRACEAFASLVSAYALNDSLPAAERTAREWVRRDPSSTGALDALANILEFQGREGEALEMRRRAASLQPAAGHLGIWLWPAIYAIRAGDWQTADSFLRTRAKVGTLQERREALWYLVISLRSQGQLREALAVARQLRAFDAPSSNGGGNPPQSALSEAIVLFDLGRFRQAAALWDSLGHQPSDSRGDAWQARHRAWTWTHVAAALHAAGDTAALKTLIPGIEAFGSRSSYGRDPRLHHHARGLLLAARGSHTQAAAEFRRAIFSPTGGYTRTNLELARVLLRLDKPNEAVAILRSAFRGPLQASNLYVTHTELHEALGQAFEAAGQPDSAAAHYRWVQRAWQSADPELRVRHARIGQRLIALGRTEITVRPHRREPRQK